MSDLEIYNLYERTNSGTIDTFQKRTASKLDTIRTEECGYDCRRAEAFGADPSKDDCYTNCCGTTTPDGSNADF